jgi:hypothetical protein
MKIGSGIHRLTGEDTHRQNDDIKKLVSISFFLNEESRLIIFGGGNRETNVFV